MHPVGVLLGPAGYPARFDRLEPVTTLLVGGFERYDLRSPDRAVQDRYRSMSVAPVQDVRLPIFSFFALRQPRLCRLTPSDRRRGPDLRRAQPPRHPGRIGILIKKPLSGS